MASKRQRSNGTWEFKFTRKGLLHRPVYFTFDTEGEGDAYAEQVEALLARGIVPPELSGVRMETVSELVELYEALAEPSQSDMDVMAPVKAYTKLTKLTSLNYPWVEGWVKAMKDKGLTPSTITKRVGLLGRVVDWALRTERLALPTNPLRVLPRGYASKGVAKEKLWAGERDRRLTLTEEGAIRKVLVKKEEHLLFDMALETAMRMREMYTLTVGQVDMSQRTIFLDKSKNGDRRQVPISSTLYKILEPVVTGSSDELLFPFWDGEEALSKATNRVSHLFASRFKKAGCPDLRFHDLRHHATALLYERTTMTDLEIASITGHKDPRMLRRYANLRGSVLATKMW